MNYQRPIFAAMNLPTVRKRLRGATPAGNGSNGAVTSPVDLPLPASANAPDPRPAAASPAPTRPAGAISWSSRTKNVRQQIRDPHAVDVPAFEMDAVVAQQFNAYALAAWPNEIGGMLRVVQTDEGAWRAIDLHIFPQRVTAATFALDEEAMQDFQMSLYKSGRKSERQEWRSLIHSHPGMQPYLSGPDHDNIEYLAGPGFAFSIICSAAQDPEKNWYAAHYAQAAPLPVIISPFEVVASQPGQSLAGTDLLDDKTCQAIKAEVKELLVEVNWVSGRPANENPAMARPTRDEPAEDAGCALETEIFADEEYSVIDTMLLTAIDSKAWLCYREQIEDLFNLAGHEEWLDEDEADLLLEVLNDRTLRSELDPDEISVLPEVIQLVSKSLADFRLQSIPSDSHAGLSDCDDDDSSQRPSATSNSGTGSEFDTGAMLDSQQAGICVRVARFAATSSEYASRAAALQVIASMIDVRRELKLAEIELLVEVLDQQGMAFAQSQMDSLEVLRLIGSVIESFDAFVEAQHETGRTEDSTSEDLDELVEDLDELVEDITADAEPVFTTTNMTDAVWRLSDRAITVALSDPAFADQDQELRTLRTLLGGRDEPMDAPTCQLLLDVLTATADRVFAEQENPKLARVRIDNLLKWLKNASSEADASSKPKSAIRKVTARRS
jgi:proteasome lid subunit RPN8/RPN11